MPRGYPTERDGGQTLGLREDVSAASFFSQAGCAVCAARGAAPGRSLLNVLGTSG